MASYVVPYFNKKNNLRQASYDYSHANLPAFIVAAQAAVEKEIQRHADKEVDQEGQIAKVGDD